MVCNFVEATTFPAINVLTFSPIKDEIGISLNLTNGWTSKEPLCQISSCEIRNIGCSSIMASSYLSVNGMTIDGNRNVDIGWS